MNSAERCDDDNDGCVRVKTSYFIERTNRTAVVNESDSGSQSECRARMIRWNDSEMRDLFPTRSCRILIMLIRLADWLLRPVLHRARRSPSKSMSMLNLSIWGADRIIRPRPFCAQSMCAINLFIIERKLCWYWLHFAVGGTKISSLTDCRERRIAFEHLYHY